MEQRRETQTAKFDLTVSITDDGEGSGWSRGLQPDLFEAETIERLMGHYANVLGDRGGARRPIV